MANPLQNLQQGGISTSVGLSGVILFAVLALLFLHYGGFRFVVAAGGAG